MTVPFFISKLEINIRRCRDIDPKLSAYSCIKGTMYFLYMFIFFENGGNVANCSSDTVEHEYNTLHNQTTKTIFLPITVFLLMDPPKKSILSNVASLMHLSCILTTIYIPTIPQKCNLFFVSLMYCSCNSSISLSLIPLSISSSVSKNRTSWPGY